MYQKKEKQIELILELLTQQMNHWMLFPLIIMIFGGTSEFIDSGEPDILMWSICSIFPVLTFLVRARIKHFIPFVFGHLCIVALAFVIPADTIICRLLCVICGVCYMIHSFAIRLKSDSMFTVPFHPAVVIGLSVFGIFFLGQVSEKHWDSYFTFTLIGCFALYLVIYYMNHYLEFLTVNESSSGFIPASEMFQSGVGLVVCYTLAGTVLLLLATNVSWLEAIWNILKKGLIILLRFLFTLFPESSISSEVLLVEKANDSEDDEFWAQPVEEPALFWKILEVICIIAFICLMIYATGKLVLFIIRFLRERFSLNFRQKRWNLTENASSDIREKCNLEKKISSEEKQFLFGFLDPGERIRKLYKKKLLGASAVLVKGDSQKLGFYTARESEEKLSMKGMAVIYEKVRYTNRTVTTRDVKQMKEACRKFEP